MSLKLQIIFLIVILLKFFLNCIPSVAVEEGKLKTQLKTCGHECSTSRENLESDCYWFLFLHDTINKSKPVPEQENALRETAGVFAICMELAAQQDDFYESYPDPMTLY